MKKSFWFLFAALCMLTAACSSDDESSTPAAVGILSAQVTPQGSSVSYNCAIDQTTLKIENSADSVQWDVTDACLRQTTVTVSTTLGGTAYCNGTAIGSDGVVVDATSAVTLEVKDDNGQSKTYTLNVVRATAATGDDMVIKASAFKGFPTGIIDYDMAYFNDKFYATVTSLSGETENYQLFTSEDGENWTEVAYKATTAEGVDCVVGDEGARMAVFNNKFYVMGGARSKGTDKYGNQAETTWSWTGTAADLSVWRAYSTPDGVNFIDEGTNATYTMSGTSYPTSYMACTQMSFAELNGKLYMTNAIGFAYGLSSGKGLYAYTSNGMDWTALRPATDDGAYISSLHGEAFFSFKDKLWTAGGCKSYISAGQAVNAIYSSTDGETWTKAADLPESMTGLYGAKVIANDNVAILFGGEFVTQEGNTLSNKVYRSTDGVNWEEVTAPAAYTARRNAKAALVGNTAWVFGGLTTGINSNYNYPSDTDVLGADTWVKLMR